MTYRTVYEDVKKTHIGYLFLLGQMCNELQTSLNYPPFPTLYHASHGISQIPVVFHKHNILPLYCQFVILQYHV